MMSRTFTLTVRALTICSNTVQFTNAPNVSLGVNLTNLDVEVGNFNNDGVQDLAASNFSSDNVSIYSQVE